MATAAIMFLWREQAAAARRSVWHLASCAAIGRDGDGVCGNGHGEDAASLALIDENGDIVGDQRGWWRRFRLFAFVGGGGGIALK